MLKTLSFFFMISVVIGCHTPDTTSSQARAYHGTFKYKSFETDLLFEVFPDSSGHKVFFTSLSQNAYQIPTQNIRVSKDSLNFTLQSDFYTYTFTNTLENDQKRLEGTLKVDKRTYPFTLYRAKEEDTVYPEEVYFESNGNTLSGSIWRSQGPNKKGVFLVTSSGYNDRSSTNAEALYFSKKRYTVFNYDKRGTGKSTGDLNNVSIEDLAGDDINALHFFSKKTKIPLSKITIMGSSQGGAKVPFILNQLTALQSGIAISTPGCSLLESDLNFMMNRLRNEIDLADLSTAKTVQRAVFEYLAGHLTKSELNSVLKANEEKDFYKHLWIPELTTEIYEELSYSPMPHFEKLQRPVLVLQGGSDIVIPEESHSNIKQALDIARNTSSKIVLIEKANHSMTMVDPQFPYWNIVHPDYYETVEKWLDEFN